jgi:hypothetical protein
MEAPQQRCLYGVPIQPAFLKRGVIARVEQFSTKVTRQIGWLCHWKFLRV